MRARNQDGSKAKKDLPAVLELAKGMKIMITTNVQTDLDVANGARGEIVDIVLHSEEPDFADEGTTIHLRYLPAYILVKLSRTRATQLEGLEQHVIPVQPTCVQFQVTYLDEGTRVVKATVKRWQYPITPAYAFTDYRAQGQTIPWVIVDIGRLPTGSLTLFNLYVALSRSRGRDTIRLLRDFDDDMFRKAHRPSLQAEDKRLTRLNELTSQLYRGVLVSRPLVMHIQQIYLNVAVIRA